MANYTLDGKLTGTLKDKPTVKCLRQVRYVPDNYESLFGSYKGSVGNRKTREVSAGGDTPKTLL